MRRGGGTARPDRRNRITGPLHRCRPPGLGEALVLRLESGRVASEAIWRARLSAPWCAWMAVAQTPLPPQTLAALLPALPRNTVVLLRPSGLTLCGDLVTALRSRAPPSQDSILGYLTRRGLDPDFVAAVARLFARAGSPARGAWRRGASPTALNRRLARHGAIRVNDFRQLLPLFAFCERLEPVGFEQRAWECGRDPRTIRHRLRSLFGVDAQVALSTPGWEWKLEALLRRHSYLPWATSSRRTSGHHRRPVLAES